MRKRAGCARILATEKSGCDFSRYPDADDGWLCVAAQVGRGTPAGRDLCHRLRSLCREGVRCKCRGLLTEAFHSQTIRRSAAPRKGTGAVEIAGSRSEWNWQAGILATTGDQD